jgi:hypothetical protein
MVDDCWGTPTKGGKEITFSNVAVGPLLPIVVMCDSADGGRLRMGLSLIVRSYSPLKRGIYWNTRCLTMINRVLLYFSFLPLSYVRLVSTILPFLSLSMRMRCSSHMYCVPSHDHAKCPSISTPYASINSAPK